MAIDIPDIAGLSRMTGPSKVSKGRLGLPASFEADRYAARWAKRGPALAAAREAEVIPGAGVVVDGWTVWRDPQTKQTCQRALANGEYVLMVRPLALQKAVTVFYANESRIKLNMEVQGQTVQGSAVEKGMLTTATLPKAGGDSEYEPPDFPLTKVPSPSAAVTAKGTTTVKVNPFRK